MGRILVTGGAGFLGQHVLERLRAAGHPLRVVVRNDAGADRVKASGTPKGEELVVADLTQRFALPKLLQGCDRVVHVAGRISSRRAERRAIYQDNVVAAAHVLEAALATRVKRFVYVSQALAVGAPNGSRAADEQVAYDLDDLPGDYAQAMRVAELEALRAWTLGLPVVFPTPTFCVGPGDYRPSAAFILEPLMTGLPVAPVGGLNLVDVRDAAAGIVAALERGEPGQRYLLGGENLSYRALLDRIAGITGAPASRVSAPAALTRLAGEVAQLVSSRAPIDRARAALFGRHWYYDHSRAARALGYDPRPIDDALSESVHTLQRRGSALEPQLQASPA